MSKPVEPCPSEPVEIIKGGDRPALLLCDHAGHEVPRAVGDLGISRDNLTRHIGWDIGAAAVTRRLASRLGATALLNHVSRLVIDVNRRPRTPTSIPAVSDGCVVPGNEGLDESEVDRRIRDYFLPYHRAIARGIARFRRGGRIPVLVAVHSFTPHLNGEDRPWPIGVLWRGDRRLAGPVLEALRRRPNLLVGDNQPYSGQREFGFTITFHAQRTRLPHIMFEIRQDEIADARGAAAYATLIGDCLEPALADAALYTIFDGDNLPESGGIRAWRHAGHISPLG
ncbi:MAG: N-formylglutamate amidohydrolase [Geminicoccaceae bacterium]|jgi:predicted N-formylglutamate amidohydrolase|nr:N-formylglutamate amidohydrolase [Geminicoccaceae bacterium]MCB9968165.1 N-formylglutamate amidohydrolase [Geminicoccaceae bacterium]HRY23113.1 N-formylglutamate amidohydrolase [Geminicoccaceae bacterium]